MNCNRCGSKIQSELNVCLRCGATPNKPQSSTHETDQPKPSSSSGGPDSESQSKQASPNSSSQETPQIRSTSASESGSASTPDDATPKVFLWGFLGIILFIAIINWNNDDSSTTKFPAQPISEPVSEVMLEKAPDPQKVRLAESKPPVGEDHILTEDQIRYCLLEQIRLEGMRSEVDNYVEAETQSFNRLVVDYQSRCSNYRYHEGVLTTVEKSVDGWEKTYRQEGVAIVQKWHDDPQYYDRSDSIAAKPMPDPLVKSSQQILQSLGYDPGPIDGVMGKKTTAAVMKFQKDYGFKVDGFVGKDFYSKLYELRPRDMSSRTFAESTTSQSVRPPVHFNEGSCSHLKESAPSEYLSCLEGDLQSKPQTKEIASPSFFSIGSHKDDVLRLQGTPQNRQIYNEVDEEVWNYPGGQVTFSIRTQQVTHFNNYANGLKAFKKNSPVQNGAGNSYFTIGSTMDDVLRLQGTPQNRQIYNEVDEEVWNYPGGQVTFSIRTQQVTHFNNYANGLKARKH